LEEVLVPGAYIDVDVLGGGLLCERADDVVGFVAGYSEPGDSHCVEYLLDAVDLGGQVLGHWGAVGLVFGVYVAAEGRLFAVEGYAEHVGAAALDQAEDGHCEDVCRLGGLAGGGGQAASHGCVVGGVNVRVAVDYVEGGCHRGHCIREGRGCQEWMSGWVYEWMGE